MGDVSSSPPADAGVRGRPRIDFATRLAVMRLVAESPQLSNVAIGAMLHISDQSVMRLRAAVAGDVKQLTQTVLQTEIAPAIEDWVTARTIAADRGDHRPARDMLVAAGAIEDSSKGANVAVGFQVVIAPSPGTPAYAVNETSASVVTRVSAPAHHELACATASAPASERTSVPALTAPDDTAPDALPLTAAPAQCAPSSAPTSVRTVRSRLRR
jgi:hypothetical protein